MTERAELEQLFAYGKRKYITLARACEWLGISKSTFYRAEKLGAFVDLEIPRLRKCHYRIDSKALIAIEERLIECKLCQPLAKEPATLPLPF
jgi:hypothetical protein